MASGKAMIPCFLLFGGCPNANCGMQAMIFSSDDLLNIDFWWVRPLQSNSETLDKETLNRHTEGPRLNNPGPSKRLLQPLADIFMQRRLMNGWRWGIEAVGPLKDVPRAVLRQESGSPGRGLSETGSGPLYILMIWQEDWTAVPRPVWKGKIIYQKSARSTRQFA